jgi:hypothetical protein
MYISDSLNGFLSITRQKLWNTFVPTTGCADAPTPSNQFVSAITDQNCPTDHPQFPEHAILVLHCKIDPSINRTLRSHEP